MQPYPLPPSSPRGRWEPCQASIGMRGCVSRCQGRVLSNPVFPPASIPEKRSEITAMTYLASCDMIACGHEDGSVVFWNPDAKK